MRTLTSPTHSTTASMVVALLIGVTGLAEVAAQTTQSGTRPMTFLDAQEFARPGSWTPSPDGRWMLYTVSTPDWQAAESQSDIHLVSMAAGLSSSRQMTYTDDKNETSPTWSRDGSFFVFASNRDASGGRSENRATSNQSGGPEGRNEDQLYYMRPDGRRGEATHRCRRGRF